jgi:hypothetical protein
MVSIKIGLQIVHNDEFLTLKAILDQPGFEVYAWHFDNYDNDKLNECDLLILFARRHWRYIKFNKPYFLILADFVSDQKAANLSKSRKLSLMGYQYTPNKLFGGYLCGSSELFEAVKRQHIKAVFYKKKYPFSELFHQLKSNAAHHDAREIVTLINNYKSTASKWKWRTPENSYAAYHYIANHASTFLFKEYGAPKNMLTFDESNVIQFNARYTIHIKYWGHVCNAVVKSLALGTPVLLDEATFNKGRYNAYVRHGENGLILKDKNEIVKFLISDQENELWKTLKATAMQEAHLWHFPYLEDEKITISNLLISSINI